MINDNVSIAILAMFFIITALWIFNATVLADKRRKRISKLYNVLFNSNSISIDEKAKLHLAIQDIQGLDRWSMEFLSALWVIIVIIGTLIVHFI